MPDSLKKLINIISLLPWIWEKSATKLALFLLNSNSNYTQEFANSLKEIKTNIKKCPICWNLIDSHKEICDICDNKDRDDNQICVVEDYLDMLTIESSWVYNWKYHILGWVISPINWVFINDLNFNSLFERINKASWVIEIIIATNPNIEWEATSNYIKEEIIKRWLKKFVKTTRLSRWLSSWYIEYADNITLINSIKERKEI